MSVSANVVRALKLLKRLNKRVVAFAVHLSAIQVNVRELLLRAPVERFDALRLGPRFAMHDLGLP